MGGSSTLRRIEICEGLHCPKCASVIGLTLDRSRFLSLCPKGHFFLLREMLEANDGVADLLLRHARGDIGTLIRLLSEAVTEGLDDFAERCQTELKSIQSGYLPAARN